MTYATKTTMTRRRFLAGTVAGTSLITLHPFSAYAAANQAHLRIMETTDLHVHIYPYDYYADKPRDTVGLARTASLIKASATRQPIPCCWTMVICCKATRWVITSPTSAV